MGVVKRRRVKWCGGENMVLCDTEKLGFTPETLTKVLKLFHLVLIYKMNMVASLTKSRGHYDNLYNGMYKGILKNSRYYAKDSSGFYKD